MINTMQKTLVWLGVITMIMGLITMVPHSAYAKKHNDNNNYSYSSTQYSNNNGDTTTNYNNGNNDGFQTAQTDWNNNVYSADSGGNPNQGCTSHHTQQYCNGYYDGYTKLWTQWQYNLAHGLNLVNSPQQDQTSAVSTNIKGNDNTVNNIITQSQAANSGNDPSGSSSGSGDLSGCRFLCSVIK
jgi:hypothetical protein